MISTLKFKSSAAVVGLLLASTALSKYDGCHAFVPASIATQRSGLFMATTPTPSLDDSDVVIIGGGLAGLSVAHRIATHSKGKGIKITVLDRESHKLQRSMSTLAGSFASGGLLKPMPGSLPEDSQFAKICNEGRDMYKGWIKAVQSGAKVASTRNGDGAKYLWDPEADEPWDVGYRSTGGFIFPVVEGGPDFINELRPPAGQKGIEWVDQARARELEPGLNEGVIGGFYSPNAMHVDSPRLTCTLRAACAEAGVNMCFGEEYEVTSLGEADMAEIHLANGKVYFPGSIVAATGAQIKKLMPGAAVTSYSQKALFLEGPKDTPLLTQVVYNEHVCMVPRLDGKIYVGGIFKDGELNGSDDFLSKAINLVPALENLPVIAEHEGERAMTLDYQPIIGKFDGDGESDPKENLYIAGGFNCAGMLLAPKIGQLVGDLIINDGDSEKMSDLDQEHLEAFKKRKSIDEVSLFPPHPEAEEGKTHLQCFF